MVREGIVGALSKISDIDEAALVLFAVGTCNLTASSKMARGEIAKERTLRRVIEMADTNNSLLNEACAKTLFNLASQEGGQYCAPVAKLGGLLALEKLSAKLGDKNIPTAAGTTIKTVEASEDIDPQAETNIAYMKQKRKPPPPPPPPRRREGKEVGKKSADEENDFDSLMVHTFCATAYDEDARHILIQDGGLVVLANILRRPSVDQMGIERKCANALLNLASSEDTRTMSMRMGAMDTLFELATSQRTETLDMAAKALFLYAGDAESHEIMVPKMGDMLQRFIGEETSPAKMNAEGKTRNSGAGATKESKSIPSKRLSLIVRRMLVRSLTMMSESQCAHSLVEDGAVGYLRELCLFDGDDLEGDGDSMTAFDSIRLVDLITTLANFAFRGNTSRMVRDGAAAALVSLVHGFSQNSDLQKNQNGRIACALRNLSCFVGNAPLMQQDGAIEAILELSNDSK